jgi:cyclophilin family peptidyl-prolyl cis-trans isomerase
MLMRTMLILLSLLLGTATAQTQEINELTVDAKVKITTTLGSFVIELDQRRAPLTTANFLAYVREGHYDGTIFHRVVQGFVAQAGGYTADMVARPASRTVVNESGNGLSNLRGTVGIARTGEPHSANAQFYINLTDNVDLDPRPTRWGYAVFGKVVEGMDVVDEIGHQPTGAGGPFDRDVPVTPIVIEHVEILHD